MAKTIVGLSASLQAVDQDGKNIHSTVSRKFSDAIQQVGGLPFIIPVVDRSLVKAYVDSIDQLILTGGQNVHPQFYGENKTIDSDDYDLERDRFELALLEETLRQDKPVMGVCRGMQLLNVAFGGSLNQHIDNHWQGLPFGTSHSIQAQEKSTIERLFGAESRINSVHHQSVKRLASGFKATAFDPRDTTIEAIESTDSHRIIGLQWHPEFLINEEKGNIELFQYFLEEL
ncbi:gamma-glutamyl-gamma-aminobutyrate hydrolase family protein [Streptococcus oricebi]|uniref:Gamma-glutamyl hydrolase n=1 Tax=Streptococcus oricebi TaxID=1547447 RepID=A0ABS5B4P2_9STRE|nr:gamma-glutamyl-gamma-aminobutyrate hydrolase family protein [Streptococcus oricebi]MBP2623818.1 gamma-glutamyl hydrolase [Streptococcus oricebi]